MKKEPFIISITENELPNLALDLSDSAFEYSRTNIWQDDNLDIIRLLNLLNEKMDVIIRLLKENGKA